MGKLMKYPFLNFKNITLQPLISSTPSSPTQFSPFFPSLHSLKIAFSDRKRPPQSDLSLRCPNSHPLRPTTTTTQRPPPSCIEIAAAAVFFLETCRLVPLCRKAKGNRVSFLGRRFLGRPTFFLHSSELLSGENVVRCALSENSRPDDAGFHLFFTGLGPGLKFLGTVKMRHSVVGEGGQGDTENGKKDSFHTTSFVLFFLGASAWEKQAHALRERAQAKRV